jgi:Protein of unknown function (DUF1572)
LTIERRVADLHETIARSFAERYSQLADLVRGLAKELTDEQFWRKPFPFGNSFGHLVLHLTGNLNYYIGAEIAGSGYVRDRDREFTETDCPPKAAVMKGFDEAVALVLRALAAQPKADWSKTYTAVREEDAGNRFNLFLRCATHLHHHVGQMVYLSYELKRK